MSALKTRTTLSMETLGDRIVPTFIPTLTGTELVLTGDASNDDAQIRDFGNGTVAVAANNGASNWVFTNVNTINVYAEDGHDHVRYDLVGSLQPGRSQFVSVSLGSNYSPNPGNDSFVANLHSGITIENRARLQISADGGGGDDYLSLTAIDVNVRAGGWVKTNFNGGFGNDTIGQVYRGQMDGSLALRSWGNDGRDTIREVMDFAPASTGRTGALVYGGNDSDVLSLYVTLAPAMTIDKLEIHGDDDGDPLNDSLNYNAPVTAFF